MSALDALRSNRASDHGSCCIYMLPFDQQIQADISAQNGLYQRYCDDILIILPQSHADYQAIATLVDEQLQMLGLRLNARKTSQHRRSGAQAVRFCTTLVGATPIAPGAHAVGRFAG